jgi:hypothetical protein
LLPTDGVVSKESRGGGGIAAENNMKTISLRNSKGNKDKSLQNISLFILYFQEYHQVPTMLLWAFLPRSRRFSQNIPTIRRTEAVIICIRIK